MRRLRRALLLLALVTGPALAAEQPAGEAPADCAEATARRVQSHYQGVRDLSAEFAQTSRVASLGGGDDASAMRARGKVVFAKPGRMRWSYEEPEKSLVVTDGRQLWTFDPALNEAQRLAVEEGFLSGAAMQFLLGEGDILGEFQVKARSCAADHVVLELEPREPTSYERLVLEVQPRDGRVDASEVTDLFGNVTRVEFSKVRTNTGPDDETFVFRPPEGTRVIEIPSSP